MDMFHWASLREHQGHPLSTDKLIWRTRKGIYGLYIPDVRYRCGLYIHQEEKNHAAVGESRKGVGGWWNRWRSGGVSIGCTLNSSWLYSHPRSETVRCNYSNSLLRTYLSCWIFYGHCMLFSLPVCWLRVSVISVCCCLVIIQPLAMTTDTLSRGYLSQTVTVLTACYKARFWAQLNPEI